MQSLLFFFPGTRRTLIKPQILCSSVSAPQVFLPAPPSHPDLQGLRFRWAGIHIFLQNFELLKALVEIAIISCFRLAPKPWWLHFFGPVFYEPHPLSTNKGCSKGTDPDPDNCLARTKCPSLSTTTINGATLKQKVPESGEERCRKREWGS